MRLDEQTLKRHMCGEVARVPIPDDMWKNVSSQLDKDAEVARRRRRIRTRLEQWKPALAFAAAAGVFWLAVIPSESSTRQSALALNVAPRVSDSSAVQPIQNDVLPAVSRFVRTEKLAQDEPAPAKFGFSRYSVSVQ